MDISIIIVNYNSKGFTLNCLRSIKAANFANLKYEIIVIDNASYDNIGEILAWQNPEVKFIQSETNLGLGGGNNLGIKQAEGKYIAIMNPDTVAFKDTFTKLFEFMEVNQEVGVVGPKQFNPDQTIQDSCYRWHALMTPFYRRTFLGKLALAKKDLARFLMKDFDKTKARDVDWLLGSCLFMRASAFKQVGLSDENYFLYFEDTDWCRRFWLNKWRVTYYPEAQIIHNHNRESAQKAWYRVFTSQSLRYHIVSWFKYLNKWGFNKPVRN